MSEQPDGKTPTQGGSALATPRDTIFDQPAPAGAAKKTSEVLAEIVWLMSQSPLHKQLFISDTEWLVMTPMLLQQFRLFYDKQKPVGVIFWASVSEEVEARLAAGSIDRVISRLPNDFPEKIAASIGAGAKRRARSLAWPAGKI